jgi:hypothetical protein
MGQLEPLEHNTHENADVDTCPACMMTTEIFNEMAAV